MTLDPVRSQASLVTLKMPAPISMPSSVAYDSTAPRSRRSEAESGAAMSAIVARAVLRALRGGGARLHLHRVEIVQQLARVAVARFRILGQAAPPDVVDAASDLRPQLDRRPRVLGDVRGQHARQR